MATRNKKNKRPIGHPQKAKKASSPREGSFQQSAFQQALAYHQAGRLPQAEALYWQILSTAPNHPEALHYLGVLAHQTGESQMGVELVNKAISCRPDYVDAHVSLGVILHDLGRLDEAEASYRRALVLKPGYDEVYSNLANALKDQGKLDEAMASFRRALRLKPDCAELHYNLGNALKERGELKEAAASYQRALGLKPDYAAALCNLGATLGDLGKLAEAVASYRRALRIKPDDAAAHYNLGKALHDRGELEEAVASYRQALGLRSDYAEAHNNLGNALKDQGRLEDAVASYRRAIALKPDYVAAHYNLGNAFKDQGRLEEAATSFHCALALAPDFVKAYNNLGNTLKDQGRLAEATANYRRALAVKPDFVEAHNNLGNVLEAQGRLEEAVGSYRRALALKPGYGKAHSNLLLCLNYLPGSPVSAHLDEARHYGRQAASKVNLRFSEWGCAANPERLRVGLVSGDFRNHPVGYFLENLLAHIDPTHIELIAYPTYHEEDDLTARIRPCFAAWKSLLGLEDEAAARLIHDDGVQILLDLAGHTANNRLPVFAWKPAPVQATWLGYPASTGLAEMDYLIADPVSVPGSFQEHFAEKVWYLPETRFCFSPPVIGEEPASTPLPALANRYITFGCFQNLTKINDEVLAVWGRILQTLPQARFRLQTFLLDFPAIREQLRQRFARSGVAPERLTLVKGATRKEYLAAHAHVDLLLDTFPFPGGTTTCEALWMGVPTVTLAGKTMLSRQGASLLACAGLHDWVATDEEDYVAKAVAHASDLAKLARLRAGLRGQVSASPLCDAPRFARNFEAAMWGMWQRFQAEHRAR